MYTLGVDTTQAACSAAVYDDISQRIVGRVFEQMPRGHAESLPQIIQQTLSQAGLKLADISKLATTTGPGTFTGVRVGLSAARGFALALDIPLVGINSLKAVAAGVEGFESQYILAAFDARRGEVYAQVFDNGDAVGPPGLCSVNEAAELTGTRPALVVGTANDMLCDLNPHLTAGESRLPDAAVVATLGAGQAENGVVQPLYIRKADAKPQTPLLHIAQDGIELTKASPAHAEVLAQIHAQGFSSPWPAQSLAQSLASPGTHGLVASDKKGDPLGFIMTRCAGDECEILTLAVRIDARRRNVATGLVEAGLEKARKAGIEKMFLEVRDDNFSAQALYRKAGFEKCGQRKDYYTGSDGQKYDAIIMQRRV